MTMRSPSGARARPAVIRALGHPDAPAGVDVHVGWLDQIRLGRPGMDFQTRQNVQRLERSSGPFCPKADIAKNPAATAVAASLRTLLLGRAIESLQKVSYVLNTRWQ